MSFCSHCGNVLSDNMKFCPSCGNSVYSTSTDKQLSPNKTIENLVASTSYTTVQNTPGYEQSMEQPKKKVNKLIIVLIIIAIGVIGATVGAIKYFTGDAYKYKKALGILKAGDYEAAFNLFYNLGNYEDSESYLPFHGKYTCISSPVRQSSYLFKKGEYIEFSQYEDNKTIQYHGIFESDEYKSAVLNEDKNEYGNTQTKMYQVFNNYIYRTGDEGYIFNEYADISEGRLSGKFSKKLRHETNFVYFDYETYVFEEDGTYSWSEETVVYEVEEDEQSEKTILESRNNDGTYIIKDNIIILMPNEENSEISLLILDGVIYSEVYVRKY